MPIDTYTVPLSDEAIQNAIKPAYQLKEEEARLDLHNDQLFTGADVQFLSDAAHSFAQSTHAEIQPRPAEVEIETHPPFERTELPQVHRNIEVKREEALSGYLASREEPPASFVKKAFSLLTGESVNNRRPLNKLTERQLIERESEIGRDLFGPIPADHRREFFYLDADTWIWHEEWVDVGTGQQRATTTRYEVQMNGILKAQDGINYRFIEGTEQENFGLATRMYYERVMREVYKTDPYTGEPVIAD